MSTRVQIPVSAPTRGSAFALPFALAQRGFEPQPPNCLGVRCPSVGCRFTRPPRARNACLQKHSVAVTHEGFARSNGVKPSSLSEKHHPRPAQRGEDNPCLCATENGVDQRRLRFFHALAGDFLLGVYFVNFF